MIVLPAFNHFVKHARIPLTARVLARKDVADSADTLIQYIIQGSRKAGYPKPDESKRKGAVWWFTATRPQDGPWGGNRATDGLRTTSPKIAASWFEALSNDAVSIKDT